MKWTATVETSWVLAAVASCVLMGCAQSGGATPEAYKGCPPMGAVSDAAGFRFNTWGPSTPPDQCSYLEVPPSGYPAIAALMVERHPNRSAQATCADWSPRPDLGSGACEGPESDGRHCHLVLPAGRGSVLVWLLYPNLDAGAVSACARAEHVGATVLGNAK